MKSNSQSVFQTIEKCIITTSTPLPDFYDQVLADGLLLYCCLYEENIETIPLARHYEIIIDFTNKNIHAIILKLFNKLLRFDCDLHVKILEVSSINPVDIGASIDLLMKLDSKNLITLNRHQNQIPNDLKALLEYKLENVTCFIGPGNTGKTSIIASLSELFCEGNQMIAMLDITKNHKLKGYFPYSINTSRVVMDHESTKDFNFYPEDSYDVCPRLYTYGPLTNCNISEISYLSKIIKYLSTSFDYVLINADEYMLSNFIDIFKIFNSIFIVHDCMLNKVHPTHKMLLNMQESGIDTHRTISMIYNKVVKKASNIGNIEEKLIFKKDEKGHLLPLIDVKCMTIEISHSSKVAASLNNKIIAKTDALNNTSLYYKFNIQRLYNFINNIEDREYSDLQLSEFFRNHVHEILHEFFSMKRSLLLKYKVKLNTFYEVIKIGFKKCTKSSKALKTRYFKGKFEKVLK